MVINYVADIIKSLLLLLLKIATTELLFRSESNTNTPVPLAAELRSWEGNSGWRKRS